MLEEVNADAEQFSYLRVEREAHWRRGLNTGDYLDAISHYKTPNSGICHYITGWCKAKIIFAEKDDLLL